MRSHCSRVHAFTIPVIKVSSSLCELTIICSLPANTVLLRTRTVIENLGSEVEIIYIYIIKYEFVKITTVDFLILHFSQVSGAKIYDFDDVLC